MGKMVAGALVASLAWGAAWWLLRPPEPAAAEPCDDRCGEGTVCEDESCVIATAEAIEEDEPATKKKRRRRRRRSGGGAGGAGSAAVEGDEEMPAGAPRVDDSHIPAFSNGPQALDLKGGSERLSDAQVNGVVGKMGPKVQRCVADAPGDGDLRGKVSVKARITGSGKVSEVTVKAPAAIRDAGVVPCIRKAIYDLRFPSFDGPSMGVDMSFEVG